MNLSLSFRKYLFDSESRDGLPVARGCRSLPVETDRWRKRRNKSTLCGKRATLGCRTWSSWSLSLPPKRGRQTRQINTTREIARTGFSTGRDSALNGPFTNFDVSTYVSFQTFYEVVDRAGFPLVKPFVSGNDDQLLRI